MQALRWELYKERLAYQLQDAARETAHQRGLHDPESRWLAEGPVQLDGDAFIIELFWEHSPA